MSIPNIRSVLSYILGIEDSLSWEITDSIPERSLYMVHYTKDADMGKFGHLRGVVVDTEAGTVVCSSFGFTPTVDTDLLQISTDGYLHMTDTNGVPIAINELDLSFKLSFEGTIIRAFKHKGIVYHATHRKLDVTKSRWGSSKTFEQMYKELEGPDDDELFDPISDYSPYCHIFLLVHPDVLVATKQRVGPGYIVYLGPKQMWSVELDQCPYKQTDGLGKPFVPQEQFDSDPRPNAGFIDSTLLVPESFDFFPDQIDQPFLYSPPSITIGEANAQLAFGFYKPYQELTSDIRTRPGEAIMVYMNTPTGEKLVKVQSSSYAFRIDMRNNDPNLVHQFYYLANCSYIPAETPEGFTNYVRRFPLYVPYSVDSIMETIKTKGPIVTWWQKPEVELNSSLIPTKDERLINIWIAYLMSVPLHRQLEVIEIYNQFIVNRGNVISWLYNIANNVDPTMEIPVRANKIIQVAREGATKSITRGPVYARDGRNLTYSEIVHNNIRNLISKEEGTSLYRLVNAWKQSLKPRREVTKPLTVEDFLTAEQKRDFVTEE